MSRRKRRRGRDTKTAVRRGVVTGGTVTLATLGLSNCNNGGGSAVDPPPPPLKCVDASQGQNLWGAGAVQDSLLTVSLFSNPPVDADTVSVTNFTGAKVDSLDGGYPFRLYFTLDSDTTSLVTFTLSGTFDLDAGPCDFTRVFTVTIDNGAVQVAQREMTLPLGPGRDVRIELVERDGLRLRLRAAGAVNQDPVWSVTAGTVERRDDTAILWELPSTSGFYQVELFVDHGDGTFSFDALSFEVS